MIDAAEYLALFARSKVISEPPYPAETKASISLISVERLQGGCVLYRLLKTPRRDPNARVATGTRRRAPRLLASQFEWPDANVTEPRY